MGQGHFPLLSFPPWQPLGLAPAPPRRAQVGPPFSRDICLGRDALGVEPVARRALLSAAECSAPGRAPPPPWPLRRFLNAYPGDILGRWTSSSPGALQFSASKSHKDHRLREQKIPREFAFTFPLDLRARSFQSPRAAALRRGGFMIRRRPLEARFFFWLSFPYARPPPDPCTAIILPKKRSRSCTDEALESLTFSTRAIWTRGGYPIRFSLFPPPSAGRPTLPDLMPCKLAASRFFPGLFHVQPVASRPLTRCCVRGRNPLFFFFFHSEAYATWIVAGSVTPRKNPFSSGLPSPISKRIYPFWYVIVPTPTRV